MSNNLVAIQHAVKDRCPPLEGALERHLVAGDGAFRNLDNTRADGSDNSRAINSQFGSSTLCRVVSIRPAIGQLAHSA